MSGTVAALLDTAYALRAAGLFTRTSDSLALAVR
jgi:hypothetical protein